MTPGPDKELMALFRPRWMGLDARAFVVEKKGSCSKEGLKCGGRGDPNPFLPCWRELGNGLSPTRWFPRLGHLRHLSRTGDRAESVTTEKMVELEVNEGKQGRRSLQRLLKMSQGAARVPCPGFPTSPSGLTLPS